MEWLDVKYVNLLSNRLRNFKRKSHNLFNFSCPICDDSQIKRNKARGYVYEKKGNLLFHCHNCNITLSVANFLKKIDYSLYNEYVLEKIKENKTPEQIDLENFVAKMKPPKFMKSDILKGLKKVSQLDPNHPVKKFVVKRKIPNYFHSKLFACPNFMNYTNSIIPNKFDEKALKHDEMKLLIPFIDSNKEVHAYQGRSLRNSEVKYITIVVDNSIPKVYGLDIVNFNKPTYVFEGPIDSMFVPNSIATAGGDLVSTMVGFDKTNLIVVYDNEPRSKETIEKINKAILQEYSVCIWPDNIIHKDVNDMILAGYTIESIEHIINQNTYKGLSAKLALTKWSKL